jgi:hypothetical protein
MGFPPHHWFPPNGTRSPGPPPVSGASLMSRTTQQVRTFMIGNRTCAFALSMALVILCSTPSAIAAQFDGNWSMVAVTTNGHCGSIPISLGISHGQVYSTGGGFAGHPVQLVGRISASGQVRMNAVAGPRSAHGTGRFNQFREGNSAMPKGKKT